VAASHGCVTRPRGRDAAGTIGRLTGDSWPVPDGVPYLRVGARPRPDGPGLLGG